MLVRSTDGGRSFSAPHRINDDPINHSKWHSFGTFSVAPNGRLDAVWLDTRNAANNTDSQLFYSSSTDGGNTWWPNIALSNSFNPFIGYPNQRKIGDYITIFQTIPVAMSRMLQRSTVKKTFITCVYRRTLAGAWWVWLTLIGTAIRITCFIMDARDGRRYGILTTAF